MGQKVHPKSFRIGTIFGWDSRWFAKNPEDFSKNLKQDIEIRKMLSKDFRTAGVAKIEIERTPNAVVVIIQSAKPGMIIGKQGSGVEETKKKLRKKFFGSQKINLNLNIVEVDKPSLNSQLVVQGMIEEIEKRIPFRRVMKQGIDKVMKAGAQGVKVIIAGRLNGAEIARSETLSQGKIPLHTIRANIDYARGTARTMYGAIGIKVWIYKGEFFQDKDKNKDK